MCLCDPETFIRVLLSLQQVLELTDGAAAAGLAAVAALVSVVVVQAALAVGPVRVVGAVSAVSSVPRGAVQLRIEVTIGALPITVAG